MVILLIELLIIGCESDRAQDKIIRRGESITLNETIEILQTEASTNSTLRQFQEIQKKPIQQIHYQSYEKSKKSKKPSNEQNSSSSTGPTESKRKCFRCGEPYSRKHLQECRAQNVTCNGCGIKGHLQKCCKKSGNFPKDNSNRQNQSSSTGSGSMNFASTLPQTEADFFDEQGLLKEYRPPAQQQQQTGGMYILRKVPIPVSDPVPDPTPEFPFLEFPLMEVVNQSQIISPSISDTLHPRETSNSLKSTSKSTDLPLKSGQNTSFHEELREIGDPTVSTAPTQSSRDSSTISITGNSNPRKSTSGSRTQTPTAFPVETDIAEAPYISVKQ